MNDEASAVFAQTNEQVKNRVLAFRRGDDGALDDAVAGTAVEGETGFATRHSPAKGGSSMRSTPTEVASSAGPSANAAGSAP